MAAEGISMGISINLDRCQGHASCMAVAPNVFTFDDDSGKARILPGGAAESESDAIDEAILACPEMAISRQLSRATGDGGTDV